MSKSTVNFTVHVEGENYALGFPCDHGTKNLVDDIASELRRVSKSDRELDFFSVDGCHVPLNDVCARHVCERDGMILALRKGSSDANLLSGNGMRISVDVTPSCSILLNGGIDYDLATSLGELVDNSIAAMSGLESGPGASIKNITIDFVNDIDAEPRLIVTDSGSGMNLYDLRAWATLGDVNVIRPVASTAIKDKQITGALGRYGVGGKNAAFQLASRVTMATHPQGAQFIYEATLDAAAMVSPAIENASFNSNSKLSRQQGANLSSHKQHHRWVAELRVRALTQEEKEFTKAHPSWTRTELHRLKAGFVPLDFDSSGKCIGWRGASVLSRSLANLFHFYAFKDPLPIFLTEGIQESSSGPPVHLLPHRRRAQAAIGEGDTLSTQQFMTLTIDGTLLSIGNSDFSKFWGAAASELKLELQIAPGNMPATSVAVYLLYFPFVGDEETLPVMSKQQPKDDHHKRSGSSKKKDLKISHRDVPEMHSINDGGLSDNLVHVFWMGRYLPRGLGDSDEKLKWMRPRKDQASTVPDRAWRRTRAFLFVGSKFEADRTKQALVAGSHYTTALLSHTEKRLQDTFCGWVERCHQTLDHETFFLDPLNVGLLSQSCAGEEGDSKDHLKTIEYRTLLVGGTRFTVGDHVEIRPLKANRHQSNESGEGSKLFATLKSLYQIVDSASREKIAMIEVVVLSALTSTTTERDENETSVAFVAASLVRKVEDAEWDRRFKSLLSSKPSKLDFAECRLQSLKGRRPPSGTITAGSENILYRAAIVIVGADGKLLTKTTGGATISMVASHRESGREWVVQISAETSPHVSQFGQYIFSLVPPDDDAHSHSTLTDGSITDVESVGSGTFKIAGTYLYRWRCLELALPTKELVLQIMPGSPAKIDFTYNAVDDAKFKFMIDERRRESVILNDLQNSTDLQCNLLDDVSAHLGSKAFPLPAKIGQPLGPLGIVISDVFNNSLQWDPTFQLVSTPELSSTKLLKVPLIGNQTGKFPELRTFGNLTNQLKANESPHSSKISPHFLKTLIDIRVVKPCNHRLQIEHQWLHHEVETEHKQLTLTVTGLLDDHHFDEVIQIQLKATVISNLSSDETCVELSPITLFVAVAAGSPAALRCLPNSSFPEPPSRLSKGSHLPPLRLVLLDKFGNRVTYPPDFRELNVKVQCLCSGSEALSQPTTGSSWKDQGTITIQDWGFLDLQAGSRLKTSVELEGFITSTMSNEPRLWHHSIEIIKSSAPASVDLGRYDDGSFQLLSDFDSGFGETSTLRPIDVGAPALSERLPLIVGTAGAVISGLHVHIKDETGQPWKPTKTGWTVVMSQHLSPTNSNSDQSPTRALCKISHISVEKSVFPEFVLPLRAGSIQLVLRLLQQPLHLSREDGDDISKSSELVVLEQRILLEVYPSIPYRLRLQKLDSEVHTSTKTKVDAIDIPTLVCGDEMVLACNLEDEHRNPIVRAIWPLLRSLGEHLDPVISTGIKGWRMPTLGSPGLIIDPLTVIPSLFLKPAIEVSGEPVHIQVIPREVSENAFGWDVEGVKIGGRSNGAIYKVIVRDDGTSALRASNIQVLFGPGTIYRLELNGQNVWKSNVTENDNAHEALRMEAASHDLSTIKFMQAPCILKVPLIRNGEIMRPLTFMAFDAWGNPIRPGSRRRVHLDSKNVSSSLIPEDTPFSITVKIKSCPSTNRQVDEKFEFTEVTNDLSLKSSCRSLQTISEDGGAVTVRFQSTGQAVVQNTVVVRKSSLSFDEAGPCDRSLVLFLNGAKNSETSIRSSSSSARFSVPVHFLPGTFPCRIELCLLSSNENIESLTTTKLSQETNTIAWTVVNVSNTTPILAEVGGSLPLIRLIVRGEDGSDLTRFADEFKAELSSLDIGIPVSAKRSLQPSVSVLKSNTLLEMTGEEELKHVVVIKETEIFKVAGDYKVRVSFQPKSRSRNILSQQSSSDFVGASNEVELSFIVRVKHSSPQSLNLVKPEMMEPNIVVSKCHVLASSLTFTIRDSWGNICLTGPKRCVKLTLKPLNSASLISPRRRETSCTMESLPKHSRSVFIPDGSVEAYASVIDGSATFGKVELLAQNTSAAAKYEGSWWMASVYVLHAQSYFEKANEVSKGPEVSFHIDVFPDTSDREASTLLQYRTLVQQRAALKHEELVLLTATAQLVSDYEARKMQLKIMDDDMEGLKARVESCLVLLRTVRDFYGKDRGNFDIEAVCATSSKSQIDRRAVISERVQEMKEVASKSRRCTHLGYGTRVDSELRSAVTSLSEHLSTERRQRPRAEYLQNETESPTKHIVWGLLGDLAYISPEENGLALALAAYLGPDRMRAVVLQRYQDIESARLFLRDQSNLELNHVNALAWLAIDEVKSLAERVEFVESCEAEESPTTQKKSLPSEMVLRRDVMGETLISLPLPPLGLSHQDLVDRYGFVGYVVNQLFLDPKILHLPNSQLPPGFSLRRDLWFSILGNAIVLHTSAHAKEFRKSLVALGHRPSAILCLDGSRVDDLGIFYGPSMPSPSSTSYREQSSVFRGNGRCWIGELPLESDPEYRALRSLDNSLSCYASQLVVRNDFYRSYYLPARHNLKEHKLKHPEDGAGAVEVAALDARIENIRPHFGNNSCEVESTPLKGVENTPSRSQDRSLLIAKRSNLSGAKDNFISSSDTPTTNTSLRKAIKRPLQKFVSPLLSSGFKAAETPKSKLSRVSD